MACGKSVQLDIDKEQISSELSSGGEQSVTVSGAELTDISDGTDIKHSLPDSKPRLIGSRTEQDTFKRRARTLTFRRKKNEKSKESKKNRNHFWTFRIKKRLPVRLKKGNKDHGLPEPQQGSDNSVCICTGYRRTEEHVLGPGVVFSAKELSHTSREGNAVMGATASGMGPPGSFVRLFQHVPPPSQPHIPQHLMPLDLTKLNTEKFPTEDIDEILIAQRARDIEQGIEISPSHHVPHNALSSVNMNLPTTKTSASVPVSVSTTCASAGNNTSAQTSMPLITQDHIWHLSFDLQSQCVVTTTTFPERESHESHLLENYRGLMPSGYIPRTVHTQVDYIHCLVPDLIQITNCGFYWGVMDRYEAEKLLETKPEGTFLLRDSAQEEFLFSVSFRRYGRSLHARIEQWNHKFSFDSHDPGVFASDTVCGLIEHYKDPSCCMFFEPLLTLPLHRTFAFSLQHLCRAVICSHSTYDGINCLPLPKPLRQYLKYYHYKQKVRVRKFECHH